MVNYNDPIVLRQDNSAGSKFWHAAVGLYFWEFVTNLDYEWSVIWGHRPFRWTICIYIITRIFTLIVIMLTLLGMDATAQYNCKLRIVFELLFGYLVSAFASLLIVLRILAIWNKKKIIIAIAVGAWVINVIFEIQSVVRIHIIQIEIPEFRCAALNLHIFELNILVTLATDIILLLIMIFGLLRLGFHERGAFGMGRLLWKQGVIWLLVATIAEVLPAVFICLNLNDSLDQMFLIPSMVTLSIAATRIHRCLVDRAFFGCTKQLSGLDSSEQSGAIEWKANRVPIAMSMEVAINMTSDQDQTQQTSQNCSLSCIEGQLCEMAGRQHKLDESMENDLESQTQVSS